IAHHCQLRAITAATVAYRQMQVQLQALRWGQGPLLGVREQAGGMLTVYEHGICGKAAFLWSDAIRRFPNREGHADRAAPVIPLTSFSCISYNYLTKFSPR